MQAALEARGLRTVPFEDAAQLYVINTCTVTARADYSDRQAIRRAIARNPGALVVVTGCYAQTNPEAVAAIPGVDAVLGTRDRHALPELLGDLTKRARPLVRVGDVFAERPDPVIPLRRFAPGYTRAFVKVQDGCQHRCSFCIVPFARGDSRSQPVSRGRRAGRGAGRRGLRRGGPHRRGPRPLRLGPGAPHHAGRPGAPARRGPRAPPPAAVVDPAGLLHARADRDHRRRAARLPPPPRAAPVGRRPRAPGDAAALQRPPLPAARRAARRDAARTWGSAPT